MSSIKRIAILLTNEDKPELEPKHPNDGIKYARFFQMVFGEATFDIFRVLDHQLPTNIDDYHLYFITGSLYSSYEQLTWITKLEDFIRQLDANKKRLIGICFGHQIIAKALGGEVARADNGWGLGLKTIAFDQQTWMQPWQQQGLNIIHIHQDQVTKPPPKAKLLSSNEFCRYESFSIGQHILTIQGHPEFGNEYMNDLLPILKQRFPNELYQRAMASLAQQNDGAIFAQWVAAFCYQPR